MSKKLRPMGDITEDLEKLLIEMVDQHKMQRYEVIGSIDHWFKGHRPDDIETCSKTGTHPEIQYKWNK